MAVSLAQKFGRTIGSSSPNRCRYHVVMNRTVSRTQMGV